jgi:ribose transport system permease protein
MTRTQSAQDEEPADPNRWSSRLGGGWILLLLAALVIFFSALRPLAFPSVYNITTLAVDASILLVLALGQTFVIITAGIDLSVGSVLVFASVVSTKLMLAMTGTSGTAFGTTNASWTVVALGTVVAILAGAAWGLVNGTLVAAARIPALIVTLGTLGMSLGFAQIVTGGLDVRAVPELLVDHVGTGTIAGIPVLVIVAAIATVIAALLLHLTRFGSRTFAIGSNAEAARRAGIPVRSHTIKIYMLAGAMAGLGAMMAVARFSTTTIGGHAADNLSTISAVVLGGTSLFGGVGSIAGTVVGVLIPIVLLNGFVILGIPPFWQTVAMGGVLILAVWIDQLKRRSRQRS